MAIALVRPGILYAWKGPALLVVNARGECGDEETLTGWYCREARCLRTLRLEIDGVAPWLCEASAAAPDTLQFTYTHPEIAEYGGGGSGQSGDTTPRDERGLPQRGLVIGLTYLVGAGRYLHSDLPYRTVVRLPAPLAFDAGRGRAVAPLRLSPTQTTTLEIRVSAFDGTEAPGDADEARREAHLERWRRGFTRVEAPANRVFEAVLGCSVRDFASFPLLEGPEDEWLTLQAGVPLYPALFGRDAITAGYPDYRIPECVGGYGWSERRTPGAYPQANTPQLWNATAFPLVLQSLLGLLPLAPYDTLVVDPALPEWLPDVILRNLRVGGATVSLRCWREDDGSSDYEVLARRGTLRIVRQPPPESLSATLWDRLTALT